MTEHVYVLGHPVAHSKSPAMHNAVYRACGLDWDYGLADCATEDEARAFLERDDWQALNITMPYKRLALEVADAPSAEAEVAGGANVLVRDIDGSLLADNTDGTGCVAYLWRSGVCVTGARVAVCGTGPTAISIMHACARAQAGSIVLLSRDAKQAAAALERYAEDLDRAFDYGRLVERCENPEEGPVSAASAVFAVERWAYDVLGEYLEGGEWRDDGVPLYISALAYGEASAVLEASDVIIDATPLGMHEGDPAPFDTELLHEGQVVLDVVYGHGETALASAARAAGCTVFDGAGMLVGQAVETVRDMEELLDDFSIPADFDVFGTMASAAGFAGVA